MKILLKGMLSLIRIWEMRIPHILGMAGDCMKDNGEGRFELCITMSLDVMIEGKLTYIKIGKVGLKNHVNLAHSDI